MGLVGDRCFDAQVGRRDSDERFHVSVEDIAGEQSGLCRADQFQMEGLFAQDNRSAAMRGTMFVLVGSSVIVGSIVIGSGLLILAPASCEEGR